MRNVGKGLRTWVRVGKEWVYLGFLYMIDLLDRIQNEINTVTCVLFVMIYRPVIVVIPSGQLKVVEIGGWKARPASSRPLKVLSREA